MFGLKKLALAAAAVMAMAGMASANSILVSAPTLSANGSDFNWDYKANLAGTSGTGSTLKSGDSFLITDIFGLDTTKTTAAVQPAGWAVSYTLPATTIGTHLGYTDSAAVVNVVFTYTGSDVLSDAALGTFRIVSSLNTFVKHSYAGYDHSTSTGDAQENFGLTQAPDPSGPPLVPVPAAVWSGLALCGLLAGAQAKRVRSND